MKPYSIVIVCNSNAIICLTDHFGISIKLLYDFILRLLSLNPKQDRYENVHARLLQSYFGKGSL